MSDERMRRWRLVLGGADPLSGDDGRLDAALGALYDASPSPSPSQSPPVPA